MTPGEISGIIGAFAALLAAGGWVANLGLQQASRRKIEAEAQKAEYDLDDTRGMNVKTLFASAGDVVELLRKEVLRLSARVLELETAREEQRTAEEGRREQRSKCQEDLAAALARIAVLESGRG